MEFDLIARIRARAAARADVVLGIGDDCALLQPPAGMQLAVTADTLNAGVHFPQDSVPGDIGWKALAVNLSDLAAMGAVPVWCLLSLSLPTSDESWVDAFLDGFLGLAAMHNVALVGGDTTRGPLSIGVTAHGLVAPGSALRRNDARDGDDVWVSGQLGDAAAALALISADGTNAPPAAVAAALRARLDRPEPRVALGQALAGVANACIDVSDGLLADLGHVCAASNVAARINVDALPSSAALDALGLGAGLRRALQASGGDDYELCFTAPPARREAVAAAAAAADVAVTRIGSIHASTGLQAWDADGVEWTPPRSGYVHFSS
ncbi:thiamine-phosphate kinase [Luteimonas sp. A277]